MDAVLRDEQRDAQPGLPGEHGGLAHPFRRGVQDRARVQVLDEVPHSLLGVELKHLADLLGQRHAPQEVGDPLRDGQRGVEVRRLEAHRSSFHESTPQYRTLNPDRLVSIEGSGIRSL
ncbi:hypothetical protein M2436_004186 [Streptomyces sp. HB372]|nr:hypothetical protein [Streptomyces sp. HB372]